MGLSESTEEREARIFHLHDDPKDCDDPEIHFGPFANLNEEKE